MSTELKQSYEFGPFRLDPENLQLLRDGQPVSLTPKAFDTLVLLVEHSGRLVLKDDLMKALWPDTFVEESNLTQTVFMLRKVLGETGSDQRYIMTVPGRGYRFAADVRQVPENGPSAVDTAMWTWVILGTAILLVAIGFYTARVWSRPAVSKLTEKDTIVLADFINTTATQCSTTR